jgi:hypothetical protein
MAAWKVWRKAFKATAVMLDVAATASNLGARGLGECAAITSTA